MAKITKSASAPDGPIHITMGSVEFDLADAKAVYTTDEADVISNAQINPSLSVALDVVTVAAHPSDYDPTDPHQNPSADHLSILGSPEAVAAADANEAAIKDAVGGDVSGAGGSPTVAATLQATFDITGVDASPVVAGDPTPTPVVTPPPATATTTAGATS